ncbi:MAG: hypothetical protein A2162_05400 [Deltaproteobacteria bacterium RBG_13_52_11b]|nr:MAG: hypothetical protein A2162_05400 [Deltaproteobacteria bacterium RBG_13_52_11b]
MEDLWKAVPAFPHFKKFTLEDKPLLDTLFTQSPPVILELTFPNLFIWRYAYQIKINRLQDSLCLLAPLFSFLSFGRGM